MEISKTYDAKSVEDKWYSIWLEKRLFSTDSSKGGTPYTIVIPPPNVTGILHMGHALNVTIQDILIRWKRMQGFNTLWIPGTDHAGIATQNVVEKALKKGNLTRHVLGREEFLKRVWQWKEQYGGTIVRQLKKLGVSCDWTREHFTMDEQLSAAVAEIFVHLYENQLIYRGNYIINWCPRCLTALSDEESAHVPTQGKLYYIRYPLIDGKKKDALIVATTRPETMLGDVALAINPRDQRYAHIKDQKYLLPIINRELPVIEDDYVDPEFGTGVVKVTPAHDPNDFEMGRRHNLPTVNVMNNDGTMNDAAGPYAGLDRFECRKKLVEDLKAAGLIEKIEDYQHSVGHCYRCDTVVEPRLSLQWFVKMKPLARPAIEAVKEGKIQFVPERWTKVYLDWMENIRDWCISRQIWWGHRIPIFYCDNCGNEWASKKQPEKCPKCSSQKIRQDEDVLDTWFSSWLWPFSTLGWPQKNDDLAFFYPTDTLVTASEIIFFWVARMIMAGLEVMHDVPFRKVFIHGTVRDDIGRKMSKSLGNSIDPLEIIQEYSADALRFSLMMVTPVGQDVYLSKEKFEVGRNFLTKIWNAARFLQMNMKDVSIDTYKIINAPFDKNLLSPEDQHIIASLYDTVDKVTEHLERFRFNDYAKELYDFIWHKFCDWYIEAAKLPLSSESIEKKHHTLQVMHHVFSRILNLLHPITPFITEELYQALGYAKQEKGEFIVNARWPAKLEGEKLSKLGISRKTVDYVENKHELIKIARALKADYGISPNEKLHYVIKPENEITASLLEKDQESVALLLKAKSLKIVGKDYVPHKMINGITKAATIFISIEGVIDVEQETRRLKEQLEKTTKDITNVNKKLSNLDFIEKAPAEVEKKKKNKKQELLEKADKLEKLIALLQEAKQ